MQNIVIDASSLVGALLKDGSVPARAFHLARLSKTIWLSDEVEREIVTVLMRPKCPSGKSAG